MIDKNEIWTPKVNETREFIEIAFDFSNPLDIVREAISNTFDADASEIQLGFSTVSEAGERLLKITIQDNGSGMDEQGLHSFFDLGNSLRKDDEEKIGEKGHGTKVYFNSSKIEVETGKNGIKYKATMDQPKKTLYNHQLPKINVVKEEVTNQNIGTKITIWGYNNNRNDHFTHEELKDYILWFTKMGSVEKEFKIQKYSHIVLKLKGTDRKEPNYETIQFGHVFPKESASIDKLFEEHLADAPNFYCKRWISQGVLPKHTDIEFQAVFYLEGKRVKYDTNKMIKRPGYSAPLGSYNVQDRYGLWICKDFIPIQRQNKWISIKGSEYTKFHAFVNCQGLKLTANRGSIDNTPSEILDDLQQVIQKFFQEQIYNDSWEELQYLENEAISLKTEKQEETDYKKRKNLILHSKIATYEDLVLLEPRNEQGAYSLYMQLNQKDPALFPFQTVDYDTHEGIDIIAKDKMNNIPLGQDSLYYVEFKHILNKNFNHSFKHLRYIVCWDIALNNGEEVEDSSKNKRVVSIQPRADQQDYTRYYLDDKRSQYKIEIFVLKSYLQEKLGIDFRARTEKDRF